MVSSRGIVRSREGVGLHNREIGPIHEHEVLLKVLVSGICRTDQYVYSGQLAVQEGLVLGHEFSGIVSRVGSQVSPDLIGKMVAVNPILSCGICSHCRQGKRTMNCSRSRMLGLDSDGSFADWVVVPVTQVYPVETKSPYDAAFAEPLAATLGLLDLNLSRELKGALVGQNRLAKLSARVLSEFGYNLELISASEVESYCDSFDYIIESDLSQGVFPALLRAVKPGGIVVIKSRLTTPISFIPKDLVSKGITLLAAGYGEFSKAVDVINCDRVNLSDLVGEVFCLSRYQDAFRTAAIDEDRKVFIVPES